MNHQFQEEKVDKNQMKECYDDYFKENNEDIQGIDQNESKDDIENQHSELESKKVMMDTVSLRMDLFNSYIKDFEYCMDRLRDIIESPHTDKSLGKEDPIELSHAENYLKQMEAEIEQMNAIENQIGSDDAKSAKDKLNRFKIELYQITMDFKKAKTDYE